MTNRIVRGWYHSCSQVLLCFHCNLRVVTELFQPFCSHRQSAVMTWCTRDSLQWPLTNCACISVVC